MKIIPLLFVGMLPLLEGCVTVNASKSLVITPQPGATKVAVTSNAVAHCYDVFWIMWCKLELDLQESK